MTSKTFPVTLELESLSLRRKVYLWMFAIGELASILGLVSGLGSSGVFDQFTLPALPLIFGVLFLALLLWPKTQPWVEKVAFAVVTLEIIGRFAFTVIPSAYYLNRYSGYIQLFGWFPTIYLFASITFPDRRRMIMVCTAIVATVGTLIATHLIFSQSFVGMKEDFFLLSSFFLSNVVFVLLLGYSAKISEQQTRWKVMAKTMADLANVDTFLEIPNRRYLETELEHQTELANRYGQELSVVSFDLDNLKDINDRHGHLGGDEALRKISFITQKLMRKTDSFGRWGGDEFLMILPHTNTANARKLTERIMEVLHNSPVHGVGQISASFGLTEYNRLETIKDLLRRVDSALYAAKTKKRGSTFSAGNLKVALS